MADSTEGPGPGTEPDSQGPAQDGTRDWGRILDAAGVIAGIALVVIVADIISDGRLISRRLPQRRPPQEDPVDSD